MLTTPPRLDEEIRHSHKFFFPRLSTPLRLEMWMGWTFPSVRLLGSRRAPCPTFCWTIIGINGQRTLVIDLAHGSTNWVCSPGCTHNFLAPDTPLPGCVDAATTTHHQTNLFSAMPPAANSEETNSFIYCPSLLQASGLLHPDAARGWCAAISWFELLCRKLAGEFYDVGHFAQAYAELIDISNRSNQAEAVAVADICRLVAQYPPGSRLGVRCSVPAVVDANGHIPNLLQDLILQVYAGLPLASELDRAVSAFRELGHWPAELLQLNAVSSAELVFAGPCADANHVDPPPAVPNDSNRRGRDAFDSNLFPAHLHQHACLQRRSAVAGCAMFKSHLRAYIIFCFFFRQLQGPDPSKSTVPC